MLVHLAGGQWDGTRRAVSDDTYRLTSADAVGIFSPLYHSASSFHGFLLTFPTVMSWNWEVMILIFSMNKASHMTGTRWQHRYFEPDLGRPQGKGRGSLDLPREKQPLRSQVSSFHCYFRYLQNQAVVTAARIMVVHTDDVPSQASYWFPLIQHSGLCTFRNL